MKRLIAVLTVLVMFFSLSACKKAENYESQISDAIGLTEEDGLKSVIQTEIDKKQNITVFLNEPIARDLFLDYLPMIIDAAKVGFGENIDSLGSLTIYLSENDTNIMTCRTDAAKDMHITAEYYANLGSDLAYFGNNIYENVTSYSDILSNYSNSKMSVYFHIKNGDLIFNTGLGKIGSIVDTRSGENKMTTYDSWDDLSKDFPALIIYLSQK